MTVIYLHFLDDKKKAFIKLALKLHPDRFSKVSLVLRFTEFHSNLSVI